MKICLSIIILFILNTNFGQISFEIDINDETKNEFPSNFVRDNNNGFVGFVNKGWHGGRLYKISSIGDTLSVPILKSDTLLRIGNVIETTSSSYSYLLACAAEKEGDPFNGSITIFMAIDSNLNVVWEKIFQFDYNYGISYYSTMQKKDGSFLYCSTPNLYTQSMFIFEFSPTGDSLNYRAYEGDSAGAIFDMTYDSDSNNVLLHTLYAYYNQTGPEAKAIEIDSEFNQISVREYPRWLDNPFTTVLIPGDRILNNATYKESYNGIVTSYIVNDDSAFTVEYENVLSNPDTNSFAADRQSVDYYYPGCYYAGGTINLMGSTNPSWFYVTMLNDTLGVEFEKYIGGDEHYRLFNITASKDGGVLLAGIKQELGMDTQIDTYIVKLDSTGCITNLHGGKNTKLVHDAIVYPNPSTSNLYIRTTLKECTFQIYNSTGAILLKKNLNELITHIQTNGLSSGNYFYTITTADKLVESGTWIKNN